MEKKNTRHVAAEDIDHALLYMHLKDLEANMQMLCDGPK